MYLKSIKAYGFKSFADKTEINFGTNINGIVGPNGSGKSNVVDAVRWVLGEQSIKSLRGESASDIIFSGSKSRKPLNSASITLTFDNTDNYLPINYSEVSIKRVMYRSGENEYFLNNEKCRLKDITNILTDTGADKESFNIISQGKIDEILSTKPSDRRLVFESAARVLKYKKRKEEAIKKLDRTNTNINRVNDILNELENTLTPLERQSRDATKYLSIKEELTNLEISLIAHNIHYYDYQTKEIETKINTLKDELVTLSTNHTNYDINILEKKDKIKELEREIGENQNTLIELTKSIEKIDANIRVLKTRQEYTNDTSNTTNILNIKESILKQENQINEIKNDLEKLNNTIKELTEKEAEYTKKYQDLSTQKNKQNTLLDQNIHRQSELKYKINYLENSIENSNNLPNSIKNIMNNQRLTGKHNVIGKLIEIEEQYQLAISTSLGGAANYLVVDTKENAKIMVEYLKENKLGRATFFPLDTIKSRTIDDILKQRIKNQEGFIGIASSLVTYNDIYQNIILNQLGNVVVTKDLTSANKISKILMNRYKIVTLDGQVVNIGGSITGGSSTTKNNIISELYELDTLKLELQNLIDSETTLKEKINQLSSTLTTYNSTILTTKNKIWELKEQIKGKTNTLEEHNNTLENLNRNHQDLLAITSNNTNSELENMMNMYYSAISSRDNLKTNISELQEKKNYLTKDIEEIEELSKQDNYYINNKEKELKELEIKRNTMNIKMDNLLLNLGEEYNITYEAAINKYKLEIDPTEARSKVRELKEHLKEIGPVNIEAIEEYDKVKTRYKFLNTQKEELKNAEDTLLDIIKEMDDIMKEKFLTTFEAIRIEFKKVFKEMFHGGEAELVLTEPDNLLETGIEIQAIPSGKNLKSISLLSGGEKTFTAISLLFAILNVKPVPFCLLDEVEAALDDANVESFGNYLYKYRDKTQFILITHKKKTMEFADILYGITMQESGVSKLVSVKLEDIEK